MFIFDDMLQMTTLQTDKFYFKMPTMLH